MTDFNKRHTDMVALLGKPGEAICITLTPEDAHLWHMATGISGEAGEILDAVKKVVIYHKPVDRENIVEELGDIEFYMEGLRQGLNITREEVLEYNYHKLMKKRYPNGYTDEAAQARADKQ